jgi:hypothetical protein
MGQKIVFRQLFRNAIPRPGKQIIWSGRILPIISFLNLDRAKANEFILNE